MLGVRVRKNKTASLLVSKPLDIFYLVSTHIAEEKKSVAQSDQGINKEYSSKRCALLQRGL